MTVIDCAHTKFYPVIAYSEQSEAQHGKRTAQSSSKGAHKLHAVDAHGMPVRIFITSGTTADCKIALLLIERIDAEALLADRSYDTDKIIRHAATM